MVGEITIAVLPSYNGESILFIIASLIQIYASHTSHCSHFSLSYRFKYSNIQGLKDMSGVGRYAEHMDVIYYFAVWNHEYPYIL
jgi:hypothetical protein